MKVLRLTRLGRIRTDFNDPLEVKIISDAIKVVDKDGVEHGFRDWLTYRYGEETPPPSGKLDNDFKVNVEVDPELEHKGNVDLEAVIGDSIRQHREQTHSHRQ